MGGRQTPGAQDPSEGSAPTVTPEIAAEAAVWIARLHGPDRSPRMERECLEWQALSAAHRLAFERCTDVWEAVPRVRLVDAYASAASRGPATDSGGQALRFGGRRGGLALACAVLVAGGGGAWLQLWRDAGVYATGVGEQEQVLLGDGTRMSLNTDTRVRVSIGSSERAVAVQAGEALFEVAKDPARPFVVRVAGSEVVAVGTVFSVKLGGNGARADDALAVTLIQGQVTVRPALGSRRNGVAPAGPLAMQAGERMRLVKAAGGSNAPATEQVDRPRIEQVTAWTRNQAIFDNASLADAVAEMNRYNRTPIVLVGDAALAELRVSGLYRTGDSAGFARAVAALHGLVVREDGGRLELASPQ